MPGGIDTTDIHVVCEFEGRQKAARGPLVDSRGHTGKYAPRINEVIGDCQCFNIIINLRIPDGIQPTGPTASSQLEGRQVPARDTIINVEELASDVQAVSLHREREDKTIYIGVPIRVQLAGECVKSG